MSERRRLSYGDRKLIEEMIGYGGKLRDIADELDCDPTAVSREIRRNRTRLGKVGKSRFRIIACQRFERCERRGLCGGGCARRCRSCPDVRCDEVCPDFAEFDCARCRRFPHVCNGCRLLNRCPKERWVYRARDANKLAVSRASESRRGVDLDAPGLRELAGVVVPLLRRGQSPKVIAVSHRELGVSASTLYRYIDGGLIEGACNMALPRKVRFKKRRRKSRERSPRRDLTGRDWQAFCELPEELRAVCKEMDTVIGRPGGKCLLTFCLRDLDIFYARLIDSKEADSVVGALDDMEMMAVDGMVVGELGVMVVLTDNGGEFDHFEDMERSCYVPDGESERRMSVYYCEPYASWQKPHIENAHTLLRRVLPKGTSFDGLTQEDVDLICSHINSYPREELGWRTPFDLLPEWGQENLLPAFGLRVVPADEVNLTPALISRR